MITVDGISKSFRVAKRTSGVLQAAKALFRREHETVEALGDMSFSIGQGEIVGYIGPNGAGKSTTIKVMSGILVPDRGTCRIMGYTPWLDRVRYVRHIGVVFGQRSQLWWDVPVLDSFSLLRDIYDVPEPQYRQTLALLTDTLELGPLLRTPVRQLSLGQRMRCEIAASLLHDPRILFLDEPTIGLDAVSKLAVRQFIKAINREKGVTVILTTHDMNDIEALAERIILIGKGRKLYDGSLAKLRGQFGTSRTITVQYRQCEEPPAVPGAKLLSWSDGRATLRIDTDETPVAEALNRLAAHAELADAAIEPQSIEETIVQLYKEHRIS